MPIDSLTGRKERAADLNEHGHKRYLHCEVCNPPPAEDPAKLRGPEIGTRVFHHVVERSYVWAPGDPAYHGGARRYDSKVVRFDNGKTLLVDDKDLEPIG